MERHIILATTSSALYHHNYMSYVLQDLLALITRAPGFLGEEFQTCCWRMLNTIIELQRGLPLMVPGCCFQKHTSERMHFIFGCGSRK